MSVLHARFVCEALFEELPMASSTQDLPMFRNLPWPCRSSCTFPKALTVGSRAEPVKLVRSLRKLGPSQLKCSNKDFVEQAFRES